MATLRTFLLFGSALISIATAQDLYPRDDTTPSLSVSTENDKVNFTVNELYATLTLDPFMNITADACNAMGELSKRLDYVDCAVENVQHLWDAMANGGVLNSLAQGAQHLTLSTIPSFTDTTTAEVLNDALVLGGNVLPSILPNLNAQQYTNIIIVSVVLSTTEMNTVFRHYRNFAAQTHNSAVKLTCKGPAIYCSNPLCGGSNGKCTTGLGNGCSCIGDPKCPKNDIYCASCGGDLGNGVCKGTGSNNQYQYCSCHPTSDTRVWQINDYNQYQVVMQAFATMTSGVPTTSAPTSTSSSTSKVSLTPVKSSSATPSATPTSMFFLIWDTPPVSGNVFYDIYQSTADFAQSLDTNCGNNVGLPLSPIAEPQDPIQLTVPSNRPTMMNRQAPNSLDMGNGCTYNEKTLGNASIQCTDSSKYPSGAIKCNVPTNAQYSAITPNSDACADGKHSRSLVFVCPY